MLCDYVVAGVGGKHTLINVYSGDIIVSELPANLFLGTYLEIDPGFEARSLDIEVRIEGKKVVGMRAGAGEGQPLPIPTGIALVLPQMQLQIPSDVLLEVIATADGYAPTTALSKRIMGPKKDSTASEPPSSQSPPDGPAS